MYLKSLAPLALLCLAMGLASCSSGSDEQVLDAAPSPAASTTPSVKRPGSALSLPTSSPIVGPEPGNSKTIKLPSGRSFLLYLPENYDESKRWPVILGFHGWQETASMMFGYTNFEAAQAITVFAQGQDKAWAPAPYATTSGEEDVDYVKDVIDSLRATYSVDDEHIHAVGMSNGGGFAVYLSCHLPDVFQSVASISAAYYTAIHDSCSDAPVGRLDMHGTDDPIVSYNGGTRHGAAYRSVQEVLAMDQKRNRCSDSAETTRLSNNSVRMQWVGCAAPLEHIRIGGGSHVWPGGAYDRSNGLPAGFASDAVLDFFGIPGRVEGTGNSSNA